MPFFSIVIPVYGCSESLPQLCERLKTTLNSLNKSYEILLVNDACPNDSWSQIVKLASTTDTIKGINLSRNFGQHKAITAGLDFASGEWIVVMDCDGQDQPEEIPKLYEKSLEGYDVVFAQRIIRKDTFFKRLASKLFWRIFDYYCDLEGDESIANFGIYSKKVITNVCKFSEQTRAFPLIVRWLGFNSTQIEVTHNKRYSGKSSYSKMQMISLAADIIVAHTNKPLRLSIKFGFLMAFFAFLYGIFLIIRVLFWATPIEGWTSVMVSLYFLAGLLIANLGIIGLYLGRNYDESKGRPIYVVSDLCNLESQK